MSDDNTKRDELTIRRRPDAERQAATPSHGGWANLTADHLAQLAEAEARPVDTTDPDAPELPAEAWAAGLESRRRRLGRSRKEAISIRLDTDVLAWFRRQGPGYQREINRLLRERMDMMGGR